MTPVVCAPSDGSTEPSIHPQDVTQQVVCQEAEETTEGNSASHARAPAETLGQVPEMDGERIVYRTRRVLGVDPSNVVLCRLGDQDVDIFLVW